MSDSLCRERNLCPFRQTAQSHMRHSDINLTMTAYGHTLTGQEAAAVEALPDLSLPSGQQQRATGTDDRYVNTGEDCAEKLTSKLTPQLTPTAYPECAELSSCVRQSPSKPRPSENRNRLAPRGLDAKRKVLSPLDTKQSGEGGIRTRGTRKGHTGFRNRLDQPLRHLSIF